MRCRAAGAAVAEWRKDPCSPIQPNAKVYWSSRRSAPSPRAVVVLRLIPGVNPTTAGFALLILVLLAATLGPRWVAITVAVGSTLSFNYFFFAPVGTFSIADAHNWVSLVAFLVAAVVGSNLFAAAQERARIAVERAQLLEEREAAELARQRGELAVDAAGVAQPRSENAADGDQRGGREPSQRAAEREPARPGGCRRRRIEPPDAPVRKPPRHGAHRCRRDRSATRMGHAGGRGRCGRRPRAPCAQWPGRAR